LFIYRFAFGSTSRIGFASAAGIFFGATTMVLSLLQAWLVRRFGTARPRGGVQ
jgi:ABC-type sugar transport system permease subunit